jgi:hypothetical protein
MISDLKLQATSYIAVIGKANAIEERARWTFSTVRISLKHSFFFGERRT